MVVNETETEPVDLSTEQNADSSDFGFLSMFSIPRAVWQHLTDSERKSAQAVISGLNISIYTFGQRQLPERSDDPAEPLPVAGTGPQGPPAFDFVQVKMPAALYVNQFVHLN